MLKPPSGGETATRTHACDDAFMIDEVLGGGVANPGAVVRSGDVVTRPAPDNATATHRLLEHLADTGFEAPRPVAEVSGGRESLRFIHGDVPLPPFPTWSLTNEALGSVATLLRRYHEAVRSFPHEELEWSTELRDPEQAELLCHNDVCLENVVFRGGRAVALLDFDFAAPGRAIWDVAIAASMCVPIRPHDDQLPGQEDFDPFERLVLFARCYGVAPDRVRELVVAIGQVKEVGARFVQRHVDNGEEGFIRMVAELPPGTWQRRLQWFEESQERFLRTLESSL